MPPTVIDLTIPLEGLDTKSLLHEWRWRVPADYEPIQMNKFGWWFFADAMSRVFLLDLTKGRLCQIASSIIEFNKEKNTEVAHSDWYQDGFVFRCHSEGLRLSTRPMLHVEDPTNHRR